MKTCLDCPAVISNRRKRCRDRADAAQSAQTRAWIAQHPDEFKAAVRRYHGTPSGRRSLRAAQARYLSDPENREAHRARVRRYGREKRRQKKAQGGGTGRRPETNPTDIPFQTRKPHRYL